MSGVLFFCARFLGKIISGFFIGMEHLNHTSGKNASINDAKAHELIQNFVAVAGEERLRQLQQIMNDTVEEMFEKIKSNEYPFFLAEHHQKLVARYGDECCFDDIHDLLAFILAESMRDDEKLSEAIKRWEFFHWKTARWMDDNSVYEAARILNVEAFLYLNYLIKEAVSKLGEKLAQYYAEKLGFPKNSLAYRYNFVGMHSFFGDIVDVFGKYDFALCLEGDVEKGDWIGDWLVVGKENPYRIKLLYKGKRGRVWRFADLYQEYFYKNSKITKRRKRGKKTDTGLDLEPAFILPEGFSEYAGIYEGLDWVVSLNNMDEIMRELRKIDKSTDEVVQLS